jgi:Holin of 3TMs, for gene-transfer release
MANETTSEAKKEDWMNSKWRPMMGWMYMLVCTMDMVIFPILWSLLQTFTHTQITQWNPLTLQGAGLFHIAMGAVLGIAAFGRTQEKLGGANNGGAQPVPSSNFTAPSAPASGFGAPTGGFGSPVPAFSAPAPTSSFGGGFGSPSPDTTASGKKIVPDFGQPAI